MGQILRIQETETRKMERSLRTDGTKMPIEGGMLKSSQPLVRTLSRKT